MNNWAQIYDDGWAVLTISNIIKHFVHPDEEARVCVCVCGCLCFSVCICTHVYLEIITTFWNMHTLSRTLLV